MRNDCEEESMTSKGVRSAGKFMCLHVCAHVWLGEGVGDKQKHNFKDNISASMW